MKKRKHHRTWNHENGTLFSRFYRTSDVRKIHLSFQRIDIESIASMDFASSSWNALLLVFSRWLFLVVLERVLFALESTSLKAIGSHDMGVEKPYPSIPFFTYATSWIVPEQVEHRRRKKERNRSASKTTRRRAWRFGSHAGIVHSFLNRSKKRGSSTAQKLCPCGMDDVLQELERFESLSQELEDLERESNETERIQEALQDAKDIVDGLEKASKSSFRKESDTWFLLSNGTFIRLDNRKAPQSLRTGTWSTASNHRISNDRIGCILSDMVDSLL